MTKHNLNDHLAWLLKRGPSLYPSLEQGTRSSDGNPACQQSTTSQLNASHEVSGAENTPSIALESLKIDASSGLPLDPLNRVVDSAPSISEENMARLQLAPHSTTKPRMLSSTSNACSNFPGTLTPQRGREAPSRPNGTQSRSQPRGLF